MPKIARVSATGFLVACAVVLLGLSGSPVRAQELPEVRIGVVLDGPWAGNEEVRQVTLHEVQALTDGEFRVRFPAESYRIGDWTLETAKENLEALLADPSVDLVITWGVLASHAVCCYGSLPKPVVAPVVIDPELQGLPYVDGVSGVHNLVYVSLPNSLPGELELFREIVPFQHAVILINAALLDAIPEMPLRMRQQVQDLDLTVDLLPIGSSAAEALGRLPAGTEAVYVWPLFHLTYEEQQAIIDGLEELRLPTFSALGGGDVERGMLASLGSDEFFPKLARRIALDVQRILLGEDAGSIPVGFTVREQLKLNLGTARRIGVSPNWSLMIEAETVDAEPEGVAALTLPRSVHEAVEANLDLEAQRRAVAAGEQEVEAARSTLFPQVALSLSGLAIDEDRAAASFGSQPQRSVAAGAGLSQVLWDDRAWAGVAIERSLQEGREEELESLRLDIAQAAATTHLNLLRAENLVTVQRNNLDVTRSNLELARSRRRIGVANPAEVYRWESQIATDRRNLIDAIGEREVAAVALSRLLHRDLDAPFEALPVDLEDPLLMVADPRFRAFVATPRHYRAFSDFVVAWGLERSPEVARVRSALEAQERALVSARRSFWSPSLGLSAALDEILDRSGAGSSAGSLAPGLELPVPDDTNWSIGIAATLPLFSGGARTAERLRLEGEVARLELLLDSTLERVEQRIRTALARCRASYPGVELSELAATAAAKNLDLVADAYARGAVSVIELVDAQAAALNAEELAANAVYDFLLDLMELERAANRFDFFLDSEQRDAWFAELARAFSVAGVELREPHGEGRP